MSATEPAPTATAGAPNSAERKRQARSEPMLLGQAGAHGEEDHDRHGDKVDVFTS